MLSVDCAGLMAVQQLLAVEGNNDKGGANNCRIVDWRYW